VIDNVTRHTLITTSGGSPIKGLPVLLRAVAVLRDWGYDVKLKIAGMNGNNPRRAHERWTIKLLHQLKLENSVELLGWCGPDVLIEHQLRSHCFVTPSYSENGCNALSEAQLVGLPCVASHSGGLTTTIEDEQTGLLFSVGDESMLAQQVERVFLDDKLATSLGSQARRRSRLRHDPTTVVQSLISAYDQTIKAAGIGALEAVEQ
jgi:glycosyltransferase involved in cell wall biosynthesis